MERTEKHTASANEVSRCLAEMESAMAEWQCALLKRHLAELEKCTARQRELCRQLGDLVLKPGATGFIPTGPGACGTATRVREQGRRFAAILCRMGKNLETLQRAVQGPSLIYRAPLATRVRMEP